MWTGVESVAGCEAQEGERIAVVTPLVDVRISNHLKPKAMWHTPSLPCDQEAVDDTGLYLARAVFVNCPQMRQKWNIA